MQSTSLIPLACVIAVAFTICNLSKPAHTLMNEMTKEISSESSSQVGGGKCIYMGNLCSHLWRPSFLWLIFTGRGGAWPPWLPPGSATATWGIVSLFLTNLKCETLWLFPVCGTSNRQMVMDHLEFKVCSLALVSCVKMANTQLLSIEISIYPLIQTTFLPN